MAFFSNSDTSFSSKDVQRDAVISVCGKYRFLLTRFWDPGKPLLIFCGLNPSTADAKTDDATIRWLMGYGRMHGHGGLAVINLFAWRATSPQDMMAARHPIQPAESAANDEVIGTVLKNNRAVLCGWGRNGTFLSRDRTVLNIFKRRAVTAYCLMKNSDGTPHHPLRVSHTQPLQEYTL